MASRLRCGALTLCCGLLIQAAACRKAPAPAALPRAPAAPRVEPPPPPEPLPAELVDLHGEIQTKLREKSYEAAARLYPRLLAELERHWGAGAPALAPYAYNFGLALRLAGREREALQVAAQGTARWPNELQLLVLEATLRARAAIDASAFDARAHELFQSILRPEHHPRLRGLRLDIASLQATWADMLLRGQRYGEALAAVEAAIVSNPTSRHAREIHGRLLLVHQQPAAALAILEKLVAERPEPTLELCAAMALLDLGRPAEAWARLEPLAARPMPELDAAASASFRESLAARSARALNELARFAEAARLLLAMPRLESEPVEAVQELVRAARGLGAAAGAAALDRRLRGLQGRRRLLELAAQARAAGFPASVPYYEAQAALETYRLGEAAVLLERAAAIGPTIATIPIEQALLELRLGRLGQALVPLEAGARRRASSLLDATSAWIRAQRGETGAARQLLERKVTVAAEPPASTSATGGISEGALAPLFQALAWLELGEPERAATTAELAGNGQALLRAELLLLDGKLDEAAQRLADTFRDVPGGAVWSTALGALIAARRQEVPAPAFDPSDWLDHARLFRSPRHGCPAPLADRLRALDARRRELLARIDGAPDDAALPHWHALLRLLREAGAARKAREVAWHLAYLRPNGFAEQRELARTLDRDEEVLPRLAALRETLRLAPGDAAVAREIAACHALLGVPP